ncbi:MAG: TlpA family protein disulfide reductase [Arcticibacter sp.]
MPRRLNSETSQSGTRKSWLNLSNIITAAIVVFMLAMVVSPDFKGQVIRALMHVGLFQPDLQDQPQRSAGSEGPAEKTSASFTDMNGKVINVSDLKGKVVFINFWATWCPPCIAEMPTIQLLYSRYKDNPRVVFIMADMDGDLPASSAFMKKRAFEMPLYMATSKLPESYFSGSLPTTVVLDKQGDIAFHHVGAADYSNPKFFTFIDQLIR